MKLATFRGCAWSRCKNTLILETRHMNVRVCSAGLARHFCEPYRSEIRAADTVWFDVRATRVPDAIRITFVRSYPDPGSSIRGETDIGEQLYYITSDFLRERFPGRERLYVVVWYR